MTGQNQLSAVQVDRAAGTLVGSAVGDALGAGYEFDRAPLVAPELLEMIGGGLGDFAPGEWTDDTAMAIPIAQTLAAGLDLRDNAGIASVATGWMDWFEAGPPDIGHHTRWVLETASRAVRGKTKPRQALQKASERSAERVPEAAGNGALMRTGPVALGYLHDREGCAQAAAVTAALTHPNDTCVEACVLWSEAIRVAILTGTADPADGLDLLEIGSRYFWSSRLTAAHEQEPGSFGDNGYVATTLQDAWAAVLRADDFDGAVRGAVSAGGDTDTVAAIAGALAGALRGVSGIPVPWQRRVHGWPGLCAPDLIELAEQAVRQR